MTAKIVVKIVNSSVHSVSQQMLWNAHCLSGTCEKAIGPRMLEKKIEGLSGRGGSVKLVF